MTDVDANAAPSSFEVLGRTIAVAPLTVLTEGQALGFTKILRRYVHDTIDGPGMVKLDQVLSKLVSKEDNDWLDWQIMEDNVAWSEVLMKMLPCLRGKDAAVPGPTKKAVKAKKAVPKKAVKKAAKRA